MNRIFCVGEVVYIARYGHTSKWVPCPDCLGNKKLVCILASGEQVGVDCAGCSRGWEGSHGVIEQYEVGPRLDSGVVQKVRNEVTADGHVVEYVMHDGHYARHEDCFATREEALERSGFLAKKAQEEENARFMAKTKDGRSWAWHVTYHRSEIRRLEKELQRHREKLELAKSKAKEAVE